MDEKIVKVNEYLCEHCKEEVATKLYETYSTINGGTILTQLLCLDCYVEIRMKDWE